MEISRRYVALSNTLSAKDLEIFNTPYLSQNGGYGRDKDAAAESDDDPRFTAAASQRGQPTNTVDDIWRRQRPQRLMRRWRVSSGRCDGNARPNSSIFNHCLKQCALHTHVCISSTVRDVYGRVARMYTDWDQGYIIKRHTQTNYCILVAIYHQIDCVHHHPNQPPYIRLTLIRGPCGSDPAHYLPGRFVHRG